jgi:hypothetical protein
LVTSLARPGGNVTGTTFLGPELVAKRLQLLRDVPRSEPVQQLKANEYIRKQAQELNILQC